MFIRLPQSTVALASYPAFLRRDLLDPLFVTPSGFAAAVLVAPPLVSLALRRIAFLLSGSPLDLAGFLSSEDACSRRLLRGTVSGNT
jgi:hypothetical protein